MFIVLSLILSWPARSEPVLPVDWTCETALAPTPDGARQLFADYVALDSGSKLFLRIEKPAPAEFKGWVLLLHGLLDSHRAWDEVTPHLLARGTASSGPICGASRDRSTTGIPSKTLTA